MTAEGNGRAGEGERGRGGEGETGRQSPGAFLLWEEGSEMSGMEIRPTFFQIGGCYWPMTC